MKKAVLGATVAALVVALLASGCSKNEGKSAGNAPAKDTIVYGVNLAAEGVFHPTLQYSNADREVVFLVYSRLVTTLPSGGYAPELAERYTVSDDSTVYTFFLRKNVKWSDGVPFTAADVAYTYETTCHPKFGKGFDEFSAALQGAAAYHDGAAGNVTGVKVIDDYTVSFTFTDPYRDAMVKFIDKPVFAKHVWEKVPVEAWNDAADLLKNPVGTGPYRLAEYVQDQYITLTANDAYFKGAPKIKTFILKVSSPDTRQAELINGDLDVVKIASWQDRDLADYTSNNIPLVEVKGVMGQYIVFDTTDANLADPRARRAILHGIDRQSLVTGLENGHAVLAETLMQPSQSVYPKDIAVYDYNPGKTAALLGELGWSDSNGDGILDKNGQALKLSLIYDISDEHLLAQSIQAQLKKAGIDVDVSGQDFNTVLATLRTQTTKFQIGFMGATYRPNPGYGGSNLWMARYAAVPEAAELLKKANASTNDAEAVANYGEWAKYIHDTAPMAVLYFKSTGYAYNPALVNYAPTNTEWFPNVETWYFK
jgi:peptide/nickel transport system substrate-binding protein